MTADSDIMAPMPHGESDLEQAFSEALGDTLPSGIRAALARGLVKAVEVATANTSTAVAAVARRRLVTTTAVITAVIVAGISIPTTYFITRENASGIKAEAKQSAHREVVASCELQAKARPQGNARALVQAITVDLAEDAFNVFPAKFKKRELALINRRIAAQARYIPGQFPEDKHHRIIPIDSFHDLQRVIQPVSLIDCSTLTR
jgi:hypothetical protein